MPKIQHAVVIEDSVNVLRLLARYCERQGIHATSARKGPAGIQLTRQLQPDLVVCDHSVAQIDGLDVLNAIKGDADTAAIPFIYTSSDLSASVHKAAMRHGADAFLAKPFTPQEIGEAITEALPEQSTSIKRQSSLALDAG